jgi:serine/threonine-protein kinase
LSISPGAQLGGYRVTACLGKGGMGEVYRAQDPKLGREVALKLLPEALAGDEERLARFEREARVLASFSHPNIGAIYGLEKSDDTLFLVLELAEGRTLRRRMEEGLGRRETLEIFHQIAQALEVAHEKGVVHRDLKPENVMITPEGVAKVLDFGLAKAFREEIKENVPAEEISTASYKSTRPGVILGTVPYMSPEQARGRAVDKRTDIWSFGCCLFEALAGRYPFAGATISDILAAILDREPDWSVLPSDTPAGVAALVRRCLQKDVRYRLHDIADARIELAEAMGPQSGPATFAPRTTERMRSLWFVVVPAVLGLVAGAALTLWTVSKPPEVPRVQRFEVELPASAPMALGVGPALALSPDGSALVYVASRGETTELYNRPLDSLEAVPLAGTEGGTNPFFAPRSDWLGFFSEGNLKKRPTSGGTAVSLADAPAERGASWGADDHIILASEAAGVLASVSAAGSSLEALTKIDAERGERSHRWPQAVPGGSAVLFTCWTDKGFDIEALDRKSGERKTLLEDGSYGRYVPTGHLVFVRGSDLMAVRFDAEKLEVIGSPVRVVDGVGYDPLTGAAHYSLDDEGTLIYAPVGLLEAGAEEPGQLLMVDRKGAARRLPGAERAFELPRLSPNNRRLAVTITEDDTSDVWVRDLERGTMTRLTFEGNNAAAIWSPDGERVVFSSDRDGAFNLYSMRADGSGEATRLTRSPNLQMPTSWSSDGRTLAFTELDTSTGFDVRLLPMDPPHEPRVLLRSSVNEVGGRFSPDGKWLAYVSDETGHNEVYATRFPEGGKWQISTDGGAEPVWARAGLELFYRNAAWMLSVSLEPAPELRVSTPRLLFEMPFSEGEGAYANFDVTSTGEFVVVQSGFGASTTGLTVVVHWFRELEQLLPPP